VTHTFTCEACGGTFESDTTDVDLLREIGRAANGQDAIPDDAVVGVTVPLRLVRAARAAAGAMSVPAHNDAQSAPGSEA
jgi:hypothetical protein